MKLVILTVVVLMSVSAYAQLGQAAGAIAEAAERDRQRAHEIQMQREAQQNALELVRIQAQGQATQGQAVRPQQQADYWKSGNEFLIGCAASMEKPDSAMDQYDVSSVNTCTGYLLGVNDGVLGALMSVNAAPAWCTPENVTVRQAGLVLVKYIRGHPEQAHIRTAYLAWQAYREAFPCVTTPS